MDSPYARDYAEIPISFQSSIPNAAAISQSEYSSSALDYTLQSHHHTSMENFYGSSMPPQDFSLGMNAAQELPFDATANVDHKDYYPSMLSPPDTPAMLPLRNATSASSLPYQAVAVQQQQMSWNPDQQMNELSFQTHHHRAMSLPHISMPLDYQMVHMNYSYTSPSPQSYSASRRSSISSYNSEKTFFCSHPGCERTFSRIQNLRSHMRCHLVTAPHNCKACGLGFKRTTDLQRHVRTMHVPNSQKPWACSRCPKRFGRSDALKRHMSSKSKDHGCPGGPDIHLLQLMEEQKRKKSLKTVVEGTVF